MSNVSLLATFIDVDEAMGVFEHIYVCMVVICALNLTDPRFTNAFT